MVWSCLGGKAQDQIGIPALEVQRPFGCRGPMPSFISLGKVEEWSDNVQVAIDGSPIVLTATKGN